MHQTVREVMTTTPITIDRNATVMAAAQLMRENDIGDVLVTNDGRIAGIVTDRDIVVRAIAQGMDPAHTALRDCCSADICCVDAGESTDRAAQVMRDNALRRLPVMDQEQVVGIISIGDLAQAEDPRSALADISSAAPNH